MVTSGRIAVDIYGHIYYDTAFGVYWEVALRLFNKFLVSGTSVTPRHPVKLAANRRF